MRCGVYLKAIIAALVPIKGQFFRKKTERFKYMLVAE